MKRLLQVSTLFIATLFMISCGSDSGGPNPEVTSIQPTSGPPGSSVTISGKGFRPHGEMDVTFGGTSATLTSATKDQIQTEVPQGLSKGSAPVEVTVEGVTVSGPSFTVETAPLKNKIVFYSKRDGDREIFIMDEDGSNQQKITDNNIYDDSPLISNNGKKILFGRGGSGNYGIYVMDADGNNARKVVDATGPFSWSPDGSKIVFVDERNGNREIYTTNIDGTDEKRLTNSAGYDGSPDWSPDGSTIAFASSRDGDSEIYTMDPQGGNIQQLTNDTHSNFGVRWSPDGSQIMFKSDRDNRYSEIYSMNADGSNQTRITNNASDYETVPSWSPDGTQIVYASDKGTGDKIFKLNADGSGTPVKLSNNDTDRAPFWSPVK